MKRVSIIGGSGYIGGDLVRLVFAHPQLELVQVTSERLQKKPLASSHPNLRSITNLKYTSIDNLQEVDILFIALPHGMTMSRIEELASKAEIIIDLSEDFRLQSEELYNRWHDEPHTNTEWLKKFTYGLPELHREELQTANYIAVPGCNPTATVLALYPFYKNNLIEKDQTVVEAKISSAAAGNKPSLGSHHPERRGAVRSYRPTKHRHISEMLQELETETIHFSATSIEMVRGILITAHVFLKEDLSEKEIWKLYRETYGDEPSIRIVKERSGIYRYPEPKIVQGTNFCDIGFEKDEASNRIVIMSAIDNLTRGSAGQAIQALNIRLGFDETTGLTFSGLHPV